MNTPREEARLRLPQWLVDDLSIVDKSRARRKLDEEIYPELMALVQRQPEEAPLLEAICPRWAKKRRSVKAVQETLGPRRIRRRSAS